MPGLGFGDGTGFGEGFGDGTGFGEGFGDPDASISTSMQDVKISSVHLQTHNQRRVPEPARRLEGNPTV
jgi:hypothetical protein